MFGYKTGTINYTAVADVVVTTNLEGTGKALRVVDFAFDGAYPAGGEAIAVGDVQLATIDFLAAVNKAGNDFICNYIPSTGKLFVIVANTGVEAGAGVLGAVVFRCLVIGDREV